MSHFQGARPEKQRAKLVKQGARPKNPGAGPKNQGARPGRQGARSGRQRARPENQWVRPGRQRANTRKQGAHPQTQGAGTHFWRGDPHNRLNRPLRSSPYRKPTFFHTSRPVVVTPTVVEGGSASLLRRRPAVPVASARISYRVWVVFYEKAPTVKAALAAVLTWSSELRSFPESSIRTLEESSVGLGASWGTTAAALRSLRRPRRLKTPSAVADNGGFDSRFRLTKSSPT